MKTLFKFLAASALVALPLVLTQFGGLRAATVPLQTVQTCTPDQILACVNGTIGAVNTNVTPASMGAWGLPRNYLDNGGMFIAQRGTGTQTCGTTSGVPITAYSADRWGCVVNVTSGAGRQQVVTSTPTPPAGFSQTQTLFRTSGALTQPVCSIQEIETSHAIQLQGQQVTLSFQAAALAGLSADNGNVINAAIVTGTGTDQGLGTFTASPAITPAWTGIATAVNQAFTITTTFTKYSVSAFIPATATEIGVELCFTPTATGAGATDGFAFTGVQLEQGAAASAFEQHHISQDLAIAQRYYWQVTEPAAGVDVAAVGSATSTTTCGLVWYLPQQMRVAPTITFLGTALSSSTWKVSNSTQGTSTLATTFLVVNTANTVNNLNLTATLTTATTAGFACVLVGAGGGSIISASADF